MTIDIELENLRLQIRDRDMQILTLEALIKAMRNCHNCRHFAPDADIRCKAKGVCTIPKLQAWEAML